MTAGQLALIMRKRGLGGVKARDKVSKFARAWCDGKVTTPAEAQRLVGLAPNTATKWCKVAPLAEEAAWDLIPDKTKGEPESKLNDPEVAAALAHREDKHHPKSAFHKLLEGGGEEAEKIRETLTSLIKDRLKGEEDLSVQDLKTIAEVAAKVIPGVEAPKQTVEFQVFVGKEGAENAQRTLTENIIWLDERDQLPEELDTYFRRKYATPIEALAVEDVDPPSHDDQPSE